MPVGAIMVMQVSGPLKLNVVLKCAHNWQEVNVALKFTVIVSIPLPVTLPAEKGINDQEHPTTHCGSGGKTEYTPDEFGKAVELFDGLYTGTGGIVLIMQQAVSEKQHESKA